MTAVLSPDGEIELPASLREQLQLVPGDDFEVSVEDNDTILLRRIAPPANRGLVDLLLARPYPFGVPPREHDDTQPVRL